MNFGRVCDESWWLLVGMVLGALTLWFLYREDAELGNCEIGKLKTDYLFFCNIGALLLPADITKEPWYIQGCFVGMFMYLTVTGVMDYRLQMVSDILHGIGLLCAGIMALCSESGPEVWWSFLTFCLVQYLVFKKMYGPADVIMYMVCAMFLAAEGRTMKAYLMHMALTFILLGVVQAFRRNINKQGNLKEPVALIPYISISFFIII